MAKTSFKNDEAKNEERALCVNYIAHGSDELLGEDDLTELMLLAKTLGYTVEEARMYRYRKIHPGNFFNSGHLDEMKEIIEREELSALIIDNELTPTQFHNLEAYLDVIVLTRTEVILQIFSLRAKTKIAKLQVELAYLEFDLPRLKGKWTHFTRIKGGIGAGKGAGETQLEVDRRRSRERIHHIKKELKKMGKSKTTSRKGRDDAYRVAFVGYTNAGKSSLFNTLCKERKYVKNELFATLDTYTRKIFLSPTVPADVLVSDTVGFIRNLPHGLVESFQSTLAEVTEANLLLHIVDASKEHPQADIESVNEVLREVHAEGIECVLVFNKMDMVDEVKETALRRKYRDAYFISVKEREGLREIRDLLTTHAGGTPYREGEARADEENAYTEA